MIIWEQRIAEYGNLELRLELGEVGSGDVLEVIKDCKSDRSGGTGGIVKAYDPVAIFLTWP